MLYTATFAAVTFTGTIYGAGLKTQQEWKEVLFVPSLPNLKILKTLTQPTGKATRPRGQHRREGVPPRAAPDRADAPKGRARVQAGRDSRADEGECGCRGRNCGRGEAGEVVGLGWEKGQLSNDAMRRGRKSEVQVCACSLSVLSN